MAEQLDLIVIHPGAAHGIYGSLGEKLTAVEPPLWARLIAGYVRDRGFSVRIIDAEAMGFSPEEVGKRVQRLNPRLACLAVYGHQPSASTQQMTGARAITHAIKTLGPTPVIMVGGHVSALPERTMREEVWINFAGVGEGPVTIAALLALKGQPTSSDYATVPGLVWRWSGFSDQIVNNPSAPLIEDLAQLHGDVWDLLPMNRYRAHNWQCFGEPSRQPYASIYTSLQCPYSCQFCCINAPFGKSGYRTRKPQDVVSEIIMLKEKYGVRTFKITDEMFILKPSHYVPIAQGLVDAGIGSEINIWAYSRSDSIRPATLSLLRRAGFRWLAIGIESGSPYVLSGTDKRLKGEDVAGVIDTVQMAGINVIGNFIFGLRRDNHQTMRETLDLAKSLRLDFANFYAAQAYPGSPLYAEAVDKQLPLPASWSGYSQHNKFTRPLDTEHISGAEVLKFRDDAFQEYFSDPSYIARVTQKFGTETAIHTKEMLQYRLERLLLQPNYPIHELEMIGDGTQKTRAKAASD